MKSQTRLLPRLDQLYLQKKSYDIHKKKLQTIQRSSSFSRRSLNRSDLNNNQEDTKSQQSLSSSAIKLMQLTSAQKNCAAASQHHMQTIQQAKPGLSYWLKKMNPMQKRIKQQQIKQNKRIRQKIKNTMSFVQQSNNLDLHQQHYTGMKRMLNKFSVDYQSKKTKLKCQIMLKKITQIEKQKLKIQQSRILQIQNKQKSTEMLNKNSLKQQNTLSSKRSRMLSQRINLITKQSTNIMKDNFVQPHKQNIITRNKSQLTSKTNSLLKNLKDPKTFIPKISNSEKFNRVKTEHAERIDSKRLFNNSKLSNLSTETAPQHSKLTKDYKLLKVNFTQPGSMGFKRIPTLQTQHFYSKEKINNSKKETDSKRYPVTRIKTEVTQGSRAVSLNKQSRVKRFDYQKKRIERYLKSKSSLSVKEVGNNNRNKHKFSEGNHTTVQKINQSACLQQKRTSIVQEKIYQSMQTIDPAQKYHQDLNLSQKNKNITNQAKQQNPSTYFATQIQ